MSFHFSKTSRQEQFSNGYIRTISAAAGYSIQPNEIDEDSIDLSIIQRGNEDIYPYITSLDVQLKCTYAHQPVGEIFTFPLSVKNYNDLRRNCMIPRVLIVVHTPESCENWIQQNESSITLNHLGYWMSLKGMPETQNTATVSIQIPTKQIVTIETLRNLMDKLAKGDEI